MDEFSFAQRRGGGKTSLGNAHLKYVKFYFYSSKNAISEPILKNLMKVRFCPNRRAGRKVRPNPKFSK